MPIYFYSKNEDQYGCFSNFSLQGFYLDGEYWKTVEHYFQGQKFLDEAQRQRVARAATPKEAKRFGRQSGLREGWDEMRDDVMRRGVLEKFRTHADIREILLATGDEELIEASPSDYYWGCGAKGTGKNRLGQILMETRTILRNQELE
jgi:N-glycosidase YbiA